MLGSGAFEFVVADRGGVGRIGVIDGVLSATILRVRDDTGTLRMQVSPRSTVCSQLLADLKTVRNEIVVYRDGIRVWEGPVTRIGYYPDRVEIDASDIMWYLSRTALKVDVDYTGTSVNAVDAVYNLLLLHYPPVDDPFNIGQYLTKINSSDDARTAANYQAFSVTLFELVDRYAEDGGIDYVVNGRRLVLFDTHCRTHILPRFSDESFTSDLGVIEYGSELATRTVTYGSTAIGISVAPQEWTDYYGVIDKVSASISEADGGNETALTTSAERRLYSSYPSPVNVLVPANSPLDPRAPVEYTDLVPGAWAAVESVSTLRKVQQWQRLAAVRTEIGTDGERVLVTFEQPPSKWVDPIVEQV